MKIAVLTLSAAALALIAASTPTMVVPLMQEVVAPQANVLWDVGNRGMDDNGNPDISGLSAEDWANLAKAAEGMKQAGEVMATEPNIKLALPGTKLDGEGSPGVSSAAQVQAAIAADRVDFAAHGQQLADVANLFLAAARDRNAQTLFDASGQLDQVCESCHQKYWYPKP